MFIKQMCFIVLFSILSLCICSVVATEDIETYDQFVGFTNITNKSGIFTNRPMGHGAHNADFDNDGCLDIFVTNTNFLKPPRTYLFANDCNMNFTNLQEASGITDFFLIRTSSSADLNNDGLIDLIIGDIDFLSRPYLYLNLGQFTFLEISEIDNIEAEGSTRNLIWVDYDRDGLIDIFQANSIPYLYKNNGNLSFDLVSIEAGLASYVRIRSSLFFDINNDQYADLFLAIDGFNKLHINNGDGTFTDISAQSGLKGDKDWETVAACSGDYNNDGYFDIYIVNIGSERNALFKNNGDNTFTDVTEDAGTQDVGDGRTCSFVDYNSDGLIDIFSTNHVNPNRLYKNLGNAKFKNKALELGIEFPFDIFSATWGDYNGDGIMDVFLNGHIGLALYEGFNLNNSVVIELVGDGINTNTSAIGSRVEVKTESKHQIREVLGGKGCCEQDMLPLHFGLGKETRFDMIIHWTNGEKCEFKDLDIHNALFYKVKQENCDVFSY